MSYDSESDSGIFTDAMFGLGDSGDGLGAVDSITAASPRSTNGAVASLQQDLVNVGLLPASGSVDGLIGPNTTTAIARAIYALSLPQDDAHIPTTYANGTITVPDAVIEAIHQAAADGKLLTGAPATLVSPATVPATTTSTKVGPSGDTSTGPGKPVLIDDYGVPTVSTTSVTPTITPTTPTTTLLPTNKWLPYAILGGGVVLAGGLFLVLRKKPTTVTKTAYTVKNRRYRRAR